MSIDLKKCKKGDELMMRNGEICTYIGLCTFRQYSAYSHEIQYSDGKIGTRTFTGAMLEPNYARKSDLDIIKIVKK